MASGSVNTSLSEVLVAILIVCSLAFEFLLHHIEHWISRRHAHLTPVLKILYRELMVLGLVSFLFIMYTAIWKQTGTTILSFEFAHIFIFLLAILYILVTMFAMFTSLRLSSRWKHMEKTHLADYLRLKDDYTALRLRMHTHRSPFWRSIRWWFPNLSLLTRYRSLHEIMAFHDIRFQFIFYRSLPETFRFSSFLRKVKAYIFINLVHTHWSLYLIFLAFTLIDLLRRETTAPTASTFSTRLPHLASRADPPPTDTKHLFKADVAESAVTITAAALLIIIAQVLAQKIRSIFWQLTKNPRLYFHDAEPTPAPSPHASAGEPPPSRPRRPLSATLPSRRPAAAADGVKSSGGVPLNIPNTLRVQNPDLATPILTHASLGVSPGRSSAASKDSAAIAFDLLERSARSSHEKKPRASPGVQFANHSEDAPVPIAPANSAGERDIEAGIVGPAPDDNVPANEAAAPAVGGKSLRFAVGPSDTTSAAEGSRLRFAAGPTESAVENATHDMGDAEDEEEGGNAMNRMMKFKSLAFTSATIAKNQEYHEKAKEMQAKNYPRIVTRLIPRLARVASPVEKMFWFGSHHFFFWCIEFTLFFSTVLMSVSSASMFLLWIQSNPISGLNIASLVLAALALVFVLVRIAGIIKNYTFVLLNASLIPEELASQAIQNIASRAHNHGGSSSSSSESEEEEEDGGQSGLRRRKTIARFLKDEAEKGHLAPTNASEVES